jgi:hypothetical protein
MSTTFAYCVLRESLTGGSVPVYAFHAGRECRGVAPSPDERDSILVASKFQMDLLIRDLEASGRPYKAFNETDGKMAGTVPVVSFSIPIEDKAIVEPMVQHLDKWRPPRELLERALKAEAQVVELKRKLAEAERRGRAGATP